ncbi:MAG TPA: cytosine permease, partial [Gaiellaceae bacterium]|nr:cytosine permease [Gaiellaceae bacterium]
KPGDGSLTFWPGVDLVLASIISWTPLAADYTRFGRDRRSAFIGAGVGYWLPTVWGFALGAVLVLERGLSDPAQIPSAVAGGSVLAVVALLMLTVDESDEAFADVYSTAVSLQNLVPRASQRLLIVVVAATATAGAIAIDLGNYLTSCTCSDRCSCRCSACCSPTGSSAARTTTAPTSSRRRSCAGSRSRPG